MASTGDGSTGENAEPKLAWSEKQAEISGRLTELAEAVRLHYETEEVDRAAESVLKRYAPRERLRRKSRMTVQEQAITAEVFFVVDLFMELAQVLPEFTRRIAGLESMLRQDAKIVDAWCQLSSEFLVEGAAPPLAAGVEPGALGWFRSWRDPAELIDRAVYGRGLEGLDRIPAEFRELRNHREDVGWQEAMFLHWLEREMRRASYPFGLEDARSRDAMAFAVQLVEGSETAGRLGSAIPDANDVSTSHALFAITVANIRNGRLRDPRSHEVVIASVSTFDMVRVGFAVQRRWIAAVPNSLVDPDSGWLKSVSSMVFPRGRSSDAVSWSSTLRRLFPYKEAVAESIDRLWPAGASRTIERTAPDWRGALPGSPRYDFVLEQSRHELLKSFRREAVEHEQSGRDIAEWDVNSVNGVLSAKLKKVMPDVYQLMNSRPVEFDVVSLPEPGDEDEGQESLSRRLGEYAVEYDERGRVIDSPYLRGAPADYLLEDGDHSTKTAPIPWVDEFLHFAPQLMTWWKLSRQMDAGPVVSTFSESETSAMKRLTMFLGWLAREVREHEADQIDRLSGSAGTAVPLIPLETRFRNDNARFTGGLREALAAWAVTVPQLPSRNARSVACNDVAGLFTVVYQELHQKWGSDHMKRSNRKQPEIFDLVPAWLKDFASDARPETAPQLPDN